MLIGKVVRLEPNIEQEEQFKKFAGTNRFAWNESKAFLWFDVGRKGRVCNSFRSYETFAKFKT